MRSNRTIGSIVGRVLGADPTAVINIEPLEGGRVKLIIVCASVRMRNDLCEEVEPESKETLKLPVPHKPRAFIDRYKATFLFDRYETQEFAPASPFEFGRQEELRRRNEDVRRHEEDGAVLIGGRRHVASGAMSSLKSDASSMFWQEEDKLTYGQTMGLRLEWLDKITREAREQDKLPMLFFRFGSAPQESVCEVDWVAIPASVFSKMDRVFHG